MKKEKGSPSVQGEGPSATRRKSNATRRRNPGVKGKNSNATRRGPKP